MQKYLNQLTKSVHDFTYLKCDVRASKKKKKQSITYICQFAVRKCVLREKSKVYMASLE